MVENSMLMELQARFDNLNERYIIKFEQVEKYEASTRTSKVFLNMIIHDFRNPTSSIKIGLG